MDVQWCWTGVQLDDGTEVTYAKTKDNLGKGTLVDKAVCVGKAGAHHLADATLEQTSTWTSLQTFIAYGASWSFAVPDEGLELTLTAVVPAQELISVISTPAYWEGQVAVEGTRRGVPVKGYGFVEQYYGSQNQNFRTMLQAVSDVVLRNVDSVFPYEPDARAHGEARGLRRVRADDGRAAHLDLRRAAGASGARDHRPPGQGVALDGAAARVVGRRRRAVQAREVTRPSPSFCTPARSSSTTSRTTRAPPRRAVRAS